jgi:hypothetical protein
VKVYLHLNCSLPKPLLSRWDMGFGFSHTCSYCEEYPYYGLCPTPLYLINYGCCFIFRFVYLDIKGIVYYWCNSRCEQLLSYRCG